MKAGAFLYGGHISYCSISHDVMVLEDENDYACFPMSLLPFVTLSFVSTGVFVRCRGWALGFWTEYHWWRKTSSLFGPCLLEVTKAAYHHKG